VNDHPESEEGEHADRDVVGGAADQAPERVTKKEADDRHRHLEGGHQEADPEALQWR